MTENAFPAPGFVPPLTAVITSLVGSGRTLNVELVAAVSESPPDAVAVKLTPDSAVSYLTPEIVSELVVSDPEVVPPAREPVPVALVRVTVVACVGALKLPYGSSER